MSHNCLAIVLSRFENCDKKRSGSKLFLAFQDQNRASIWSPALVESINSLEYTGFVKPCTIFVRGIESHIECIRDAWARRTLKPPAGYAIQAVGDIAGFEFDEIQQTPFVSLPEAMCMAISSVNQLGKPASLRDMQTILRRQYADMKMPNQAVFRAALAQLAAEGKICGAGDKYFIANRRPRDSRHGNFFALPSGFVSPTDYPRSTKDWLFQEKRSGEVCSRECQTGASIVNGPTYKQKCDKSASGGPSTQRRLSLPDRQGVGSKTDSSPMTPLPAKTSGPKLAKFFNRFFRRRSKSKPANDDLSGTTRLTNAPCFPVIPPGKCNSRPPHTLATFAAQFPPPEWLHDPQSVDLGPTQSNAPFFRQNRGNIKEPPVRRCPEGLTLQFPEAALCRPAPREPTDVRQLLRHQHHLAETALPDHQHHPVISPRREKRRQRLSKYLSSSSECLAPLTSRHAANWMWPPRRDLRRQQRNRVSLEPGFKYKPPASFGLVGLDQLPVSEPCCDQQFSYGFDAGQCSERLNRRPRRTIELGVVPSGSGSAEVDSRSSQQLDGLSEVNGLTSSPTPPRDTLGDGHTTKAGDACSRTAAVDSAVSVSSNAGSGLTDPKYSSWSGSEGKHADLQQAETERHENEKTPRKTRSLLDHTYENLRLPGKVLDAHSTMNSTLFEQITDATLDSGLLDDQSPVSAPTDAAGSGVQVAPERQPFFTFSQQYVSAL